MLTTVLESFDITVGEKLGYGKFKSSLVKKMTRDQFPEGQEIAVGSIFIANSPDRENKIRVIEVEGDNIKVDGNHEFAGKTLNFTGKVLDVREATDDELGHGHVPWA